MTETDQPAEAAVPPRSTGPHRVEVDCDGSGAPVAVRFVCDGDISSRCHSFPDCCCEAWTYELHGARAGQPIYDATTRTWSPAPEDVPAAPGHEDVAHPDICWVDPWFNAALGSVEDWVEAFTGETTVVAHPDGGTHDDLSWLVSGSIETSWEDEYMTWEYPTDPADPADPADSASRAATT